MHSIVDTKINTDVGMLGKMHVMCLVGSHLFVYLAIVPIARNLVLTAVIMNYT